MYKGAEHHYEPLFIYHVDADNWADWNLFPDNTFNRKQTKILEDSEIYYKNSRIDQFLMKAIKAIQS